jgi:phosphoribosyl-ATP pyrophosphohydrolase/phosphoribosyl-AMP cyclohydrolase
VAAPEDDSALKFDRAGLIPAVAQDRLTGAVRMVAWMNREALERTLREGRATFFSRSRGSLWQKGETSENFLLVREVVADCDADTLILLVDPQGPTCHTGRPTCFFRTVAPDGRLENRPVEAVPFLEQLERVILERREASVDLSYTRSLLDGGAAAIGAKLREEANELGAALQAETAERVASEAADLLYHLLVGLRLREVDFRKVIEVLANRAGTGGHAEKAARRAP